MKNRIQTNERTYTTLYNIFRVNKLTVKKAAVFMGITESSLRNVLCSNKNLSFKAFMSLMVCIDDTPWSWLSMLTGRSITELAYEYETDWINFKADFDMKQLVKLDKFDPTMIKICVELMNEKPKLKKYILETIKGTKELTNRPKTNRRT